ncbi:MAG: Sugar-specific transcriptional regulator TrmB [Candidatus Methanofastidiosum methylothiophilum]|uniref:Sugar-specific transcriptional regulator TrmB n=1 Tax=Candidatus Methanofastidiosum methylothiophilum TaxID=1705564 RepID=A0A150JJZ4_9EURY|nr:MAG: Sugar-specific transcriptional regulator TrmB [Candidatus Methanofastidiosum methylthiophilus]KYC57545.1 MAG: Sugar-specific transcriptional regulator TrmB [Candidatus Methanofastidiosum methylthiophilus]KYC57792.1 MAG: Sugar-specific transcriptional regulator TrmB [Candidatus Methanofastidiosum methylthiophilus]OQC51817.1 MAG: Sugar-specific transcriptional regulator TrmB [Euryarchaeota archaeon ADurb.Bin023]
MINMEIEKQLMRVGLTEYEAKVLISIAKNNEISAKEISINSGVPYSRIYDTINSLLKKQWINKRAGRPSLFLLGDIDGRIEEYIDESRQITERIKFNLENLSEKEIYELSPTINVERNWKNFYKKIEKLSNTSKQLTCVFGFYNQIVFEKINLILKNKYGPKNLFLKSELLNNELAKELKKMSSLFNIRVLPFTPKVLLFLFDGKDIIIVLPPSMKNTASEEGEIKILEIRNFEIGKILEKMIEIALSESLPLNNI